MRWAVALFVASASAAYVPHTAEWSAPLNSRRVLVPAKSTRDNRAVRDVPEVEINSVEQLIYDINITIGNQDVTIVVDSGSFSLWTATPDYLCTDIVTDYPQEECGIVGAYRPENDPSAVQMQDAFYSVTYGSGFASGQAWNTSVTVAGIEVQNYSIGYADEVSFDAGDQIASGIMGLGLGAATGFYYNNATNGALVPQSFFSRLKEVLNPWQFAM